MAAKNINTILATLGIKLEDSKNLERDVEKRIYEIERKSEGINLKISAEESKEIEEKVNSIYNDLDKKYSGIDFTKESMALNKVFANAEAGASDFKVVLDEIQEKMKKLDSMFKNQKDRNMFGSLNSEQQEKLLKEYDKVLLEQQKQADVKGTLQEIYKANNAKTFYSLTHTNKYKNDSLFQEASTKEKQKELRQKMELPETGTFAQMDSISQEISKYSQLLTLFELLQKEKEELGEINTTKDADKQVELADTLLYLYNQIKKSEGKLKGLGATTLLSSELIGFDKGELLRQTNSARDDYVKQYLKSSEKSVADAQIAFNEKLKKESNKALADMQKQQEDFSKRIDQKNEKLGVKTGKSPKSEIDITSSEEGSNFISNSKDLDHINDEVEETTENVDKLNKAFNDVSFSEQGQEVDIYKKALEGLKDEFADVIEYAVDAEKALKEVERLATKASKNGLNSKEQKDLIGYARRFEEVNQNEDAYMSDNAIDWIENYEDKWQLTEKNVSKMTKRQLEEVERLKTANPEVKTGRNTSTGAGDIEDTTENVSKLIQRIENLENSVVEIQGKLDTVNGEAFEKMESNISDVKRELDDTIEKVKELNGQDNQSLDKKLSEVGLSIETGQQMFNSVSEQLDLLNTVVKYHDKIKETNAYLQKGNDIIEERAILLKNGKQVGIEHVMSDSTGKVDIGTDVEKYKPDSVLHTHPFSEEVNNLRFSDTDIQELVDGTIRKALLLCGNEIATLDMTNVSPSDFNSLKNDILGAYTAVFARFGAEIKDDKLVGIDNLSPEIQNQATDIINNLIYKIIKNYGGDFYFDKIENNDFIGIDDIKLPKIKPSELTIVQQYIDAVTSDKPIENIIALQKHFGVLNTTVQKAKQEIDELIEQYNKSKSFFKDESLLYDIMVGKDGGVKTKEEFISEINSMLKTAQQEISNVYNSRGELTEDQIINEYYGEALKSLRAAKAFGIVDLKDIEAPFNDQNYLKQIFDKFEDMSPWSKQLEEMGDDSWSFIGNLIEQQERLNALQRNGGQDYIAILEKTKALSKEIEEVTSTNTEAGSIDVHSLDISKEDAQSKVTALELENQKIDSILTSLHELDTEENKYYLESFGYIKNKISALEELQQKIEKDIFAYEHFDKVKRHDQAKIFSQETDKTLNSRSNAPKELEKYWEELEDAILDGSMLGQEAIEKFNQKAKELGITFDEIQKKWIVDSQPTLPLTDRVQDELKETREEAEKTAKSYQELKNNTTASSTPTKDSNISSGNEIIESQNKIQEEFSETQKQAKDSMLSIEELYKVLKQDSDIDKELFALGNSSTGLFSLPNVGTDYDFISEKLINSALDNCKEQVDSLIHTHSERIAAFSPDDIYAAIEEMDKGIIHQYVKGIDEVTHIDFSQLSKKQWGLIAKKFEERFERLVETDGWYEGEEVSQDVKDAFQQKMKKVLENIIGFYVPKDKTLDSIINTNKLSNQSSTLIDEQNISSPIKDTFQDGRNSLYQEESGQLAFVEQTQKAVDLIEEESGQMSMFENVAEKATNSAIEGQMELNDILNKNIEGQATLNDLSKHTSVTHEQKNIPLSNETKSTAEKQTTPQELGNLSDLEKAVLDVGVAADIKTEAFRTEGEVVENVVNKERGSLEKLSQCLDAIKTDAINLGNELSKIKIETGVESLSRLNVDKLSDKFTNLFVEFDEFAKAMNEVEFNNDLLKQLNDLLSKGDALKDLAASVKGLNSNSTSNQVRKATDQTGTGSAGDTPVSPNKTDIRSIFNDMQRTYNSLSKKTGKTSDYKKVMDKIKKQVDDLEALKEKGTFSNADLNTAEAIQTRIEGLVGEANNSKYNESFQNKLTNFDKSLANWEAANPKAVKAYKEEIEKLRASLADVRDETDFSKLNREFVKLQTKAKKAGNTGLTAFDKWKGKLENLVGYLTSFASFYDIINIGKQAFSTVVDLDTQQVELAKVSEQTLGQIKADFQDYANIAKEYGATVSDTISATSDWSRNGYNVEQAKELSEAAILYKNVSDGMDIDSVNSSLISTIQGFQLEAEDAISVIDKFNEVSNNYAISSGGIGDALQRSAASFNSANTDLSESIALITATMTKMVEYMETYIKNIFNCWEVLRDLLYNIGETTI